MSRARYLKMLQEQFEASQRIINDLVQENYMLKELLRLREPSDKNLVGTNYQNAH